MRAAAAGANAKLFTPHQWNCVESGNAAVDGLKATSFPMDAGGEHDLPVPTEKWAGDVDRAPAGVDAKQQQQQQPRASTSSDRGSDNDAHPHQGDTHAHTHSHATGHGYGAAPAPSSSSRPIWESELLGWPSEFAAREMDFFDLEELEERRSGWLEGMEK